MRPLNSYTPNTPNGATLRLAPLRPDLDLGLRPAGAAGDAAAPGLVRADGEEPVAVGDGAVEEGRRAYNTTNLSADDVLSIQMRCTKDSPFQIIARVSNQQEGGAYVVLYHRDICVHVVQWVHLVPTQLHPMFLIGIRG